jgi:hypothetical protein
LLYIFLYKKSRGNYEHAPILSRINGHIGAQTGVAISGFSWKKYIFNLTYNQICAKFIQIKYVLKLKIISENVIFRSIAAR